MNRLASTSGPSTSLWARLRAALANALRISAEVNQIVAQARLTADRGNVQKK
jgi:hypothetical protein